MSEYAYDETVICNLALDKVGAKRISNITGSSVQAEKCALSYYHVRNSLQRIYLWRFNADRAQLAQNASWDTDTSDQQFEWEYRYALPADFVRLRAIYDSSGTRHKKATYRCAIEETYLYSNENVARIRYSKLVTDPGKFDSLFVETLKLKLANDLYSALAKTGTIGDRELLQKELKDTMTLVRSMDQAEQNLIGRDSANRWIDARNTKRTGRIVI